MPENTARGTCSQTGGQKVHPQTYRDTDSMEYKKSYQVCENYFLLGCLRGFSLRWNRLLESLLSLATLMMSICGILPMYGRAENNFHLLDTSTDILIQNESGPRETGVWKKVPVTPDPTDPGSEVPRDLQGSIGEGGIGSVIGRRKKLEQQMHEIEESEV